MKYSVVYSSKTGNTKMLANTICNFFHENKCVYIGSPNEDALQADIIFIGFWTDKGRCNDEIAEFCKSVHHKKLFLFGTAGFGQDPEYFHKILRRTQKYISKDNEIIGTYMCQGKMPMSVRQRYEKMAHSHSPIPNVKNLIENFDQALNHPNTEDLNKLENCIRKALSK